MREEEKEQALTGRARRREWKVRDGWMKGRKERMKEYNCCFSPFSSRGQRCSLSSLSRPLGLPTDEFSASPTRRLKPPLSFGQWQWGRNLSPPKRKKERRERQTKPLSTTTIQIERKAISLQFLSQRLGLTFLTEDGVDERREEGNPRIFNTWIFFFPLFP